MSYPLFQGLSLLLVIVMMSSCMLLVHLARWAYGRLPVVRRLLAESRALRADAERERRK